MRYSILILITVLIAPLADAAIYKWIDEQGQVHYGDRPPPDQSHMIQPTPAARKSSPGVSYDERKELQRKMLDVYQEERHEKKTVAEKRRQEKAERKEKCRKARLRYEGFNNASGIFEKDEHGERKYMDQQARKDYLTQLKAEMERWCGR